MNNFERKNLKIFNLVDIGFSEKTINKIFLSCQDHYLTEDDIRLCLNNGFNSSRIINEFKKLNTSFYSIYCLLPFDINIFIIDRLKSKFLSIEQLADNLESLASFHLQKRTEDKIYEALNQLNFKSFIDLRDELLEEIVNNEPFQNNKLKEKILNKYPSLSVENYDNAIEELVNDNKIIYSIDGFKIMKKNLFEFLNEFYDKDTEIILKRLSGMTLQEIGNEKKVSRERIRQIIDYKIKKYPIFYNEERYFMILNTYELSNAECKILGLDDQYLIEYVKIKYKLNPYKNSLNYIIDFNILKSEQAKKILNSNNLILIDGDFVQKDFIELFKKYIVKFDIHSFCIKDIKDDYNKYLLDYYVENEELYINDEKDIIIKSRKLDHNKYFLPMGNFEFFVYRPDFISFDFIESLDGYLNEFNGYGSIILFYNNNKIICNKNYIFNEKELYALAKAMFEDKYKDRIIFSRNPVIITRGIDKEQFLENMILDMDLPCKVDDYLDYVNKTTGLKKDSVYGQFIKKLKQYMNSQGLLTLDNEVTDEQYNFVKSIMGNCKCVGYKYLYDKVELKYGNDAQIILNTNNLRKINLYKTNTSVFSSSYNNRLEAVLDAIDKLDEFVISEYSLFRISNIEYFNGKTYDFIDTNSLIKISKNEYLNLRKRNQSLLIKKLKDDLNNILKNDAIYVLEDFMLSNSYYNLLKEDDDYNDLLLSFNSEEILKNIIISMRIMNYIETKTTFIFSKKDLSISLLIDNIMNEYGALTLYELERELYDTYRIEKSISNTELADMGYYCPKSSERVYLTREDYEKELEEYLNGNS